MAWLLRTCMKFVLAQPVSRSIRTRKLPQDNPCRMHILRNGQGETSLLTPTSAPEAPLFVVRLRPRARSARAGAIFRCWRGPSPNGPKRSGQRARHPMEASRPKVASIRESAGVENRSEAAPPSHRVQAASWPCACQTCRASPLHSRIGRCHKCRVCSLLLCATMHFLLRACLGSDTELETIWGLQGGGPTSAPKSGRGSFGRSYHRRDRSWANWLCERVPARDPHIRLSRTNRRRCPNPSPERPFRDDVLDDPYSGLRSAPEPPRSTRIFWSWPPTSNWRFPTMRGRVAVPMPALLYRSGCMLKLRSMRTSGSPSRYTDGGSAAARNLRRRMNDGAGARHLRHTTHGGALGPRERMRRSTLCRSKPLKWWARAPWTPDTDAQVATKPPRPPADEVARAAP